MHSIPNIAGSVIPNIALSAAGNANDFIFLFLVFTPTASVAPPCAIIFITGYLTLTLVGPVFVFLENSLLTGVQHCPYKRFYIS